MRLLCSLVVLFSAALLLSDEVLLHVADAGRSPESVWRLSGAGVRAENCAWPDGEPGLTVKFSYDADPKGWAGAKLWFPEELRDWRKGRKLRIEVFCSHDDTVVGLNLATYHDKMGYSWWNMRYSAGRHTIELDLNDLKEYDLSSVKYLNIHSCTPKEEIFVQVGDIALELIDEAADNAKRTAEMAALEKDLLWRKALLQEDGGVLPDDLTALLSQNASLGATPQWNELSAFQKSCLETFPVLDRMIFRRNAGADGVGVLCCHPEEKILRDRMLFLEPPSQSIALEAARGEGESAQLVVLATKEQTGVRAELLGSPLRADGLELPLSAISLSPVGYVKCNPPKYQVDYVGYWPDPIFEGRISAVPVGANCFQGWWLDVEVPADQLPGIYTGKIRVTADGGFERELDYSVRVRDVVLPPGAPYFSTIQFLTLPGYPKDPAAREEQWRKYARMLLRHHLQADDLYRYASRKNMLENSEWFLANHSGSFNIGRVEIRDNVEENIVAIGEAYRKCKAAGILDRAYIYAFDECTPDKFPAMREILRKVRAVAPGVPIVTTAYDDTYGLASGLDDLVDVWIPTTAVYARTQKRIDAARSRGKKVGYYVACGPWMPYANFLLEYPANANRLLVGMMAWKFVPDAFLYYHACIWRQNGKGATIAEPLDVEGQLLLPDPWTGDSNGYNGDGRLLYPGIDGPLPTTRLKAIRDGMDDWIYLDLLRKRLEEPAAAERPEAWRTAARKELEIENEIVTSFTEWTRDPGLLREKRTRILDLLESAER